MYGVTLHQLAKVLQGQSVGIRAFRSMAGLLGYELKADKLFSENDIYRVLFHIYYHRGDQQYQTARNEQWQQPSRWMRRGPVTPRSTAGDSKSNPSRAPRAKKHKSAVS